MTKNYFLSIAASDNSGGAGIQKDQRVACDLGFWPLTAVSGITVQNFNAVIHVEPVMPLLLKAQIETCFQAFSIDAVKIGALCSSENIRVTAQCLKEYKAANVVIDPVLSSTAGTPFLNIKALGELTKYLFPEAVLITPNKSEFEMLSGKMYENIEEATKIAVEKSKEWNTAILLKGGHYKHNNIKEALISKDQVAFFEHERKNLAYNHGTGCTLSSAIACYLGNGQSLTDAYLLATEYLLKNFEEMNRKK